MVWDFGPWTITINITTNQFETANQKPLKCALSYNKGHNGPMSYTLQWSTKVPWSFNSITTTQKLDNEKKDVFTNGHYGRWRCDFLVESTAHLIVTWWHPKKFRVWTNKLALLMENNFGPSYPSSDAFRWTFIIWAPVFPLYM